MPILREWRAEIRRAKKAAYVEYVRTTGIAGYRGTPGCLGAAVAVRDLDADRSEVVTLSWWTSDTEYLLTRPSTVLHYESSDLYSSLTPEGQPSAKLAQFP